MIFKPFTILTLNTKTNEWSKRNFTTFQDWYQFVKSCVKFPGEYNFQNTDKWIQSAKKFQKDKRYTDYHPRSKEYREFWLTERRKCTQGIIVDDYWISPDLYWFWNYTPIFDKVKMKTDFPEVWDSHYHYDLYLQLAWLEDVDGACVKSRQKGMEQPHSELVMSEKGWVTMGDLQIGDKVYTPKGTLTSVIDKFPQGKKDVYEVFLKDGRSVRCGENHLWKVYDKRSCKYKTVFLKDLLERDLTYEVSAPLKSGEKKKYKAFRYNIPEIEPLQFPKKDLKIPPYVLGCLIGDGEFKSTPLLSSADDEIFERVISLLGEDYEYGMIEQKENHQRRAIIYKHRFNKEKHPEDIYGVNLLNKHLKEYGLFKKTKDEKFIPDDYLHSDVEDRIELLKGLLDTDGFVNAKGYDIHFTSAYKKLSEQVLYLCRSLGLPAWMSDFGSFQRIRIGNKISLFHLTRKKERQRLGRDRYIGTNIIGIKKLDYKEESSCILVEDPDHLYITKDFIPTHNSLYHVARLMRRVWFGERATVKIVGFEEEYVLGEWGILENYRDHVNEHTGWYRPFSPSETLNWEQKIEVTYGTLDKKKVTKGNKSKIKGATTKKNISKAVGGSALEIYATEAGIYQNLKKVKGYVDPNIKMGGVKTGMFVAAGAVGELKDAEDLQEFILNPKAHGIKSVKDVFSGTNDEIGFFFPDEWNYVYKDEESGVVVKCYDEHGNSDLTKALEFLALEEERQKQKDETSYKLWKSQHPRTVQDAFDQRENNIFPTQILKEQQLKLLKDKDILVELHRDSKGKVFHKFSSNPPVYSIKPNPKQDNRGTVIIYEFPIDNPPFGLYVAGVDPIYNLDTETSKSLMAITIYMCTHEREGKLLQGYPVASYVGRHKKATDTYQVCLDLIEFYNARTAVESNVKDFIEWVIRKGKSKLLFRRRELTAVTEMMPNSTIRDEIGVRMEGEFKKRALEKAVLYCEEPIADEFDLETGESKTIYGASRLKDRRLIQEMLRWSPKLNTDSLVSFMLALLAAESYHNRHIVQTVQNGYYEPEKKKTPTRLPSQFSTKRLPQQKKLGSHFGRSK
jgi:hypothetical protein